MPFAVFATRLNMKNFIRALIAVCGLVLAGCTTSHPTQRCEYKFVCGDGNFLNQQVSRLASDGWQIMSVTSASTNNYSVVTLKRPQDGDTTSHPTQQWEYKFISGGVMFLNQVVARLASDGWQIMSVTPVGANYSVVTLSRPCYLKGDQKDSQHPNPERMAAAGKSAVKVEDLMFPASIEGKEYQLEARIYRPDDSAKHPFIVMNHGRYGLHPTVNTNEVNDYAVLNRALASRGYSVMMLVRRGYGNSQGPDSELKDTAIESGLEAAKDIQCAVAYLRQQRYVNKDRGLIMGQSQGGWAALASSTVRMEGVRGVVNLAGGTNYRQMAGNGEVTPAVQTHWIAACRELGKSAAVPTLWIYAENDWNHSPAYVRQMCEAFQSSGGKVKLVIKPPYGNNGHFFASEPDLFMADLLEFFANIGLTN
jgi:dienelactone hydrolase